MRLLRAMVKIHVETPARVRVEPVGLAPHRQHGFLSQIFRKNVRKAVAHQKPLHPRGEMTEQFGEGGAIPVQGDASQQSTALLLGGNAIVPIRRSQHDNPRRARGSVPKLLPGWNPCKSHDPSTRRNSDWIIPYRLRVIQKAAARVSYPVLARPGAEPSNRGGGFAERREPRIRGSWRSRSSEAGYRAFRQRGFCRSAIASPCTKPTRGLAGIATRWTLTASRSTRASSSTTKRPIRIFRRCSIIWEWRPNPQI